VQLRFSFFTRARRRREDLARPSPAASAYFGVRSPVRAELSPLVAPLLELKRGSRSSPTEAAKTARHPALDGAERARSSSLSSSSPPPLSSSAPCHVSTASPPRAGRSHRRAAAAPPRASCAVRLHRLVLHLVGSSAHLSSHRLQILKLHRTRTVARATTARRRACRRWAISRCAPFPPLGDSESLSARRADLGHCSLAHRGTVGRPWCVLRSPEQEERREADARPSSSFAVRRDTRLSSRWSWCRRSSRRRTTAGAAAAAVAAAKVRPLLGQCSCGRSKPQTKRLTNLFAARRLLLLLHGLPRMLRTGGHSRLNECAGRSSSSRAARLGVVLVVAR